ncbi:hypothetical protein X975_08942, partial [Stegodyphus mimosarum]
MRIISPLLKLGLGGGTIYFAVNQGLFSDDQKKSIEASKKFSKSVPAFDPYLEKIPKVMSKEELINYWNTGVKISISALASLPDNTKEAFIKGVNYLKEEIKNQLKT